MKVLVVGDACLDVYLYGECIRMCPDAPIPVFVPIYKKENKGMAGNVYENLLSLGVATDLKCNSTTITKTRYVEEKTNHMFLRVDSGEEEIGRISDLSIESLEKYDAVVISDYNKGYLYEEDIKFICDNHSLVFLDTKKIIGEYCKGCSFIKINGNEYRKSFEEYDNPAKIWAEDKMIVTLGFKGCRFRERLYSVEKVEIRDTSGAGDTFLAAFVHRFLQDKNIEKSLKFANKCSTAVVQQKGVNVV